MVEGRQMKLTQVGDTLDKVEDEVVLCTDCRLCKTRKRAVPGEGSGTARIMFVGEAPGRQEDENGRPFVGAAGKLLTELLESIGLRREDVYITNVVKCRPPENRTPFEDEAKACRNYLERQIFLISPKIVCPMGNSAIGALLATKSAVSELRGSAITNDGVTYLPMYHPAAALYDPKLRTVLEKDFEKLKEMAQTF